jgi:hypothetical protein
MVLDESNESTKKRRENPKEKVASRITYCFHSTTTTLNGTLFKIFVVVVESAAIPRH